MSLPRLLSALSLLPSARSSHVPSLHRQKSNLKQIISVLFWRQLQRAVLTMEDSAWDSIVYRSPKGAQKEHPMGHVPMQQAPQLRFRSTTTYFGGKMIHGLWCWLWIWGLAALSLRNGWCFTEEAGWDSSHNRHPHWSRLVTLQRLITTAHLSWL